MVTIRYQRCDRKGRISTAEKTFRSEQAMQAWVARQQDQSPSFLNVIAYSKDQA